MYKKLGLSLALVLMSGNAWAEETSGICGETAEDCSWRYEDGKLIITGNGKMNDYSIPNNRPWAAWNNNIKEIEMSGITQIGFRAFWNCGKVEHITIPASVKQIQGDAFAAMSVLKNIDFENNSQLEKLEWAAFGNIPKLTTLKIPETVKYISGDELYGTNVRALVLPEGVFEDDGFIDYRALKSSMTIYCPKKHQQKCEEYLKTAIEAKDSGGHLIREPLQNITLQTYEQDGDVYFIDGKWYEKPNDVLTGKHIKKLRYTVEEAIKATEHGDKFHVYLTYK